MKKLYTALLFLCLFVSATASATTIAGTVTINNVAVANGSVSFTLLGCSDPLVNSSVGNPAVQSYTLYLDANGNLPSSQITGNDVIYCSGLVGNTYYQLEAFNQAGGLLWNRYYRITGSLWNINTATVLTNFSISNYVLTNPPGDQIITVPPLNRLAIAGGLTIIDNLQLGQDPTLANQAATKSYVDNAINSNLGSTPLDLAGKLSLTGGTMTGPLILAANPSNALGAATKQYVDNSISTLGGGTISSIALTVPSDESVNGSPLTTSGTLGIVRKSQAANLFLASPSGTSGTPVYRAIVPTDVPTLNQSTTGNATTATALAAAGTPCTSGQVAGGVDVYGNAINCITATGGSSTGVSLSSSTNQTIIQNSSNLAINSNNVSNTVTSTTNLALNTYSTGPGYYINNGPWHGTTGLGLKFFNNTPGINQGYSTLFTNYALGDAAFMYAYNLFYGGCNFGSDECNQGITMHNSEVGYSEANINTPIVGGLYYTGGISSPGTSTYINNLNVNNATYVFSTNGAVVTLSAPFPVAPTSSYTMYFYIYGPNTAVTNSITPTSSPFTLLATIPVTVPAGTTGTKIWTNGVDFTTSFIPQVGDFLGAGGWGSNPGPGFSYSAGSYCIAGSPSGTQTYTHTCGQVIIQATQAIPTNGSTSLAFTNFHCYHGDCNGQSSYGWPTGGYLVDFANPTPPNVNIVSKSTVLGDSMAYTVSGPAFSNNTSTAWSLASNVLTVTAANGYSYGQSIVFTSPTFNGGIATTLTIIPTGLSTTQFEASYTGTSTSATEPGTVTPAVSTAWGSINSCTPSVSNMNSQQTQSTTCQVTLGTSPASPSGFVVGVADIAQNYIEDIQITAVGIVGAITPGVQSVTFNTYHNYYGGPSLIMQGGLSGSYAINNANLVPSINFWPIGYKILGNTAPNVLLIGDCLVGGCIGPSTGNILPGASYSRAGTLTRTSNVVSVTTSPTLLDVTNFPAVGSAVTVSGCTIHTDLNGTYTITVNSKDNINPILSWSQTGANEVDSTCTISNPPTSISIFPGSIIVSSPSVSSLSLEPNLTTYNINDDVRALPVSEFVLNDIQIYHSASSPSPYSNGILALSDIGLYPASAVLKTGNNTATTGISGGSVISADGGYYSDIYLNWRPVANGTIIYQNSQSLGSFSPYYLFQDGYNKILVDPANQFMEFPAKVEMPELDFINLSSIPGVRTGTITSGLTSLLGNTCTTKGIYNFVAATNPEIDYCNGTIYVAPYISTNNNWTGTNNFSSLTIQNSPVSLSAIDNGSASSIPLYSNHPNTVSRFSSAVPTTGTGTLPAGTYYYAIVVHSLISTSNLSSQTIGATLSSTGKITLNVYSMYIYPGATTWDLYRSTDNINFYFLFNTPNVNNGAVVDDGSHTLGAIFSGATGQEVSPSNVTIDNATGNNLTVPGDGTFAGVVSSSELDTVLLNLSGYGVINAASGTTVIPLKILGNNTTSMILEMQNANYGNSNAEVEFVSSDASGKFGFLGMNSAGFTGTGSYKLPYATTLGTYSGDLTLYTATANAIHFEINGAVADTATIDSTGLSAPIINVGQSHPYTLYSVAGTPLPTCNAGTRGNDAKVSDATAPAYMTPYAGSGQITADVICSYNGTTFTWLTR